MAWVQNLEKGHVQMTRLDKKYELGNRGPGGEKARPDSKVVKTDFIQELLQSGKVDLGIELGSISNTA